MVGACVIAEVLDEHHHIVMDMGYSAGQHPRPAGSCQALSRKIELCSDLMADGAIHAQPDD
eukprot:7103324-Pyramimonas_sp.AAC.1